MEDFAKLLAAALDGVGTGATVITAGSKEELASKITEAIEAEERDQESDRLTNLAITMTPHKAAVLAAASLLGVAQEFEQGHNKCARLRIRAADSWIAVGNLLQDVKEWSEMELQAARSQQAEPEPDSGNAESPVL
jgi:hypothetical protein